MSRFCVGEYVTFSAGRRDMGDMGDDMGGMGDNMGAQQVAEGGEPGVLVAGGGPVAAGGAALLGHRLQAAHRRQEHLRGGEGEGGG